MMVYGGLLLENLVRQDEYYNLQMALFNEGLIDGLQLLVAHPSFTPELTSRDLRKILDRLPTDLQFMIHYGAENRGVDFGQTLDEKGVYADHKGEMSWAQWNRETIEWGIEVAKRLNIASHHPLGVAHVGYGQSSTDTVARRKIVEFLTEYPDPRTVALENVPPLVILEESEAGVTYNYWGFGGTPDDMAIMMDRGHRCLIDFTHLIVMVNQAKNPRFSRYLPKLDLKTAIQQYLDLPHWPICHFSGIPPTLIDNHDYIDVKPPACLRKAIQEMDTVCLEIRWGSDTARRQIQTFKEFYGV